MPIEEVPLQYTTRAEVESVLGQVGVNLRVDDDDDGVVDNAEEVLLDDAIWEATDLINESALHHYTEEVLETSAWVRRRASYIAAHIIGRRRGNATIFCDEMDQIKIDLRAIQQGTLNIPRMAKRADFSPRMSNQVVDQNYAKAKIRVDRQTSVGPDDEQQDTDYLGMGRYW